MEKSEKRIDDITKMYPVLEKVPREERLNIFYSSVKSPIFWLTLVGLIIIWFYFFGLDVIQLSGNIVDADADVNRRTSFVVYAISLIKKGFIPVVLPILVMLFTMFKLRGYLIKKNVEKFIKNG